ncbi:CHC2 zinc finger domain-containing protein [Luteolibacter algae]|uniref:CHC2 zinc finger domain-containing protein n=1 Tax=Luteolibacter algae TaxID=454151 RepID=A0ABW5D855_9BACT
MPRLTEEEIAQVKASTDLIALIQSRGIALKQKGANWTGLCPFHDDTKTPNLIVTPGKGLFRCMAAGCEKSGNAIQFVQWHDGVSFRHAFELLTQGGKAAFTASASKHPGKAKRETVPRLECPLEREADDAKVLEQVASYYQERIMLPAGQVARDYLASRGLDGEGLIEHFGIGLSDRTLGLRLPHKNRKAGAELRGQLQQLGVYRKTGREHLNGCVVVPVRDEKGNIRQLYGRRIASNSDVPKDNRHLYLARPLAGMINAEALKNREIILTESILDALTFYRHGMEAVTCTFGTANFSDELFDALRAAKIESVKLAFDGDEAGEKASAKAAERLQAIGIDCHRLALPWGSDANSYALDQGGEALRHLVRTAEWVAPKTTPSKVTQAEPQSPSSQENLRDPSATSAAPRLNPKPAPASSLAADLAASNGSAEVAKERKPTSEPTLIRKGDCHELALGPRTYRIGGLDKNNSLEVLKVTLRLSYLFKDNMGEGSAFHVDSLDLYRDSERRRFIERAAEETLLEKDLIKRDLGKLLLLLETAQEDRLNAPLETESEIVELTAEEEREALQLLRAPDLLDQIIANYDAAGVVGEQTNLLAAYLACASRKLAKPLAIIIQSTSAAGKSTLMEAVLSFFPGEDQVKYSAMTGQSLYYLGESNLKHKILAIVEEEGAEKASYALKLLQSEGELTIASTGKDPNSGRMETQEYHVEGPVAIVLTTTSIDIDEELMNRCLVLTVDESTAQTERIHALQREARTIEGILAAEERKDILRLMQNAQRLLKPWKIANPYARELTFTSGRTRTRRDHEKYLTLIDSIALLHQHQREPITHTVGGREVKMLPVTLADIEAANRIAPEVLGRSLDELPPQTRRLLDSAKVLVVRMMAAGQMGQGSALFSRRELREATGWSAMQIRRHLERLIELEYVAVRGGRNGVTMKYELLVDAQEKAESYRVGLIDTAKLKAQTTKKAS